MNATSKGLLLGLLGYTVWAGCDAANKLASEHGATPLFALFFVNLLNALFIVAKVAVRRQFASVVPKAPIPVALRSVSYVFMVFCCYTAYSLLPLANAYVVEFFAPFLIALGAVVFLKERLTKKIVGIIALGFLGVVIAINPTVLLDDKAQALGYLAASGVAVSLAISQLYLRHLSLSETPEAILLPSYVLSSLVGAAFLPSFEAVSTLGLLYLVAQSASSLMGIYLMIWANRLANASMIAPLQYFQLLIASILGAVIWHTMPTWNLVVGAVAIIAAGIVLAKGAQIKKSV